MEEITGEQAQAERTTTRNGRDAAHTRAALVRAARGRFANQGYRSTTVRDIAADAGVNVALINRYFGSKEGLFEACMMRTSDELGASDAERSVHDVISSLVGHVVRSPDGEDPLQLLLLLRTSGDENADRIRRRTLENFTESLARSVGWLPERPDASAILLRAQIAIAALLGTAMLRTSAATDPIASADSDELADSLGRVLRALLAP